MLSEIKMGLSFLPAITTFIVWKLYGDRLVKQYFEKCISDSDNYCFRKVLIYNIECLDDTINFYLLPLLCLIFIIGFFGSFVANIIISDALISLSLAEISKIFKASIPNEYFGVFALSTIIASISLGIMRIGFLKKGISCLKDISCTTLKQENEQQQ